MVHDEHKPFGDEYDYRTDPEGLIYWKKGRVAPGEVNDALTTLLKFTCIFHNS